MQNGFLAMAEDDAWTYAQCSLELSQLVTIAPRFGIATTEAIASNVEGLKRLYPRGINTPVRVKLEPVKIWSLAELADAENLTEPPAFLAGDMLCSGGVLVLAGRRGVGKTYLTLWLASRLALGLDFGPYRTRAANVLFVSQEMSELAIRKRIRKLFPDPATRATLGRRLRIVCRVSGIKLDAPEGAAALRALVEQEPTDVVILDTLRKFKGRYDENSNNDMGDLMDRLNDEVATPTKAAFVLVHHMGKPDKDGVNKGARGGSAIEDAAEDVIYLGFGKQDRKKRTGEIDKSRDGELEGQGFEFEIVSAGDPDTSPVVEVLVHAVSSERQDDVAFDINKLRAMVEAEPNGSMYQAAIQERMSWSRSTASRHLNHAQALGLMDYRGEKGHPKLWFCTTPKAGISEFGS